MLFCNINHFKYIVDMYVYEYTPNAQPQPATPSHPQLALIYYNLQSEIHTP